MKKTILFFMLLLVSTFLFADDVIILRSSVRIDGKIESISNTELRYKKANDLTGATFITPLTEVSLIIWENGEVISYADIKAAPKPVAQKVKVTPKKEVESNSVRHYTDGSERGNRYASNTHRQKI